MKSGFQLWGKCFFTRADEDKRGGPAVPKIDLQTAVSNHCYSYSVSLPALSLQFSAFLAAVLPCVLSETLFPCTQAPALARPLGLSEKLVRNSDWGTPSPSHSWYCF